MEVSFSFMEAELPSSDFVFDGTNSDMARQLYLRAKAGDQVPPYENFNMPSAVQSRLDDLHLSWFDLPGIAQRALLWDSGFAVRENNLPVKIWTLDNHSMADLAVPLEKFQAVECVEKPRVWKHWTNDSTDGRDYIVFAIHTIDKENEPAWNKCPDPSLNGGYGSLVLPCFTTGNISDAIQKYKKEVQGSPWVSRWLVEDYSSTRHDAFNLVLLVPIILGLLVLVGLVVLFGFMKKRQQKTAIEDSADDSLAYLESFYRENFRDASQCEYTFSLNDSSAPTIDDTASSWIRGSDRPIKLKSSFSSSNGDFTSGSNNILNTLLGSKFLAGKRVSYDKLVLKKPISRGAHGEVWLGEYQGSELAVKRLLQTKPHRADEVEEFALEIELSASLVHPNIISFLGVAWNSLNNLVMLLEFFPTGDLQDYLAINADSLLWTTTKTGIAVGVGRALAYLHHQTPPLIHRDLKSKNILLTTKLEPKLIDFGVSRGTAELTMTAGVGTPYWMAPEILEGKRYSEQADIYSFGVVLSELDSGKMPYHNVLRDGKKPKPIQILANVMAGVLRPNFTDDCPAQIRRIGELCCEVDPDRRPTAAQVVKMLEEAS